MLQLGAVLLVAIVCGGIVVAYGVRTALVGRTGSQRVAKIGGTVLFGSWAMEAFHWAMSSWASFLGRAGVTPDALTMTSLVVVLGSIPLAAMGHFAWSGVVLLLGAMFDAFDGVVARERGIASDSGEMLDAIVDRYADAAPFVGLALYYRDSLWQMCVPMVALVGSAMVSYARAKAEALDLDLPSGLMRRHERITYVAVALVFGPLVPFGEGVYGARHLSTLALVGLVGVLSNVAAAQLTLRARAALVSAGRGPGGPAR